MISATPKNECVRNFLTVVEDEEKKEENKNWIQILINY